MLGRACKGTRRGHCTDLLPSSGSAVGMELMEGPAVSPSTCWIPEKKTSSARLCIPGFCLLLPNIQSCHFLLLKSHIFGDFHMIRTVYDRLLSGIHMAIYIKHPQGWNVILKCRYGLKWNQSVITWKKEKAEPEPKFKTNKKTVSV